jgi:hypothetical protein
MMRRSESGSFVRALAYAALMMLITMAAHAADTSMALYDRDPEHLWNRLYEAIAVRTEGGIKYGIDRSRMSSSCVGGTCWLENPEGCSR